MSGIIPWEEPNPLPELVPVHRNIKAGDYLELKTGIIVRVLKTEYGALFTTGANTVTREDVKQIYEFIK